MEYAVKVLNTDTNELEKVFVGKWADCRSHAYELIKEEYPDVLVGMPNWAERNSFHLQGDEDTPGYVGYNHPGGSPGSTLWIVISDANPPPPAEHEPFDYTAAIIESAELMHAEIIKPGNEDILEAVKSVGNHDGDNGHFMFGGFKLDTAEQTTRWNGIVEIGDKHGHSGASYGFACRQLQAMLAD